MSRRKGRANEQALVLYLATLYYKAERILRQYQEAGQPDVKAEKNGQTITFEMKARRDSYATIYDLYDNEATDGRLCFSLDGVPVAMSYDLTQLLDSSTMHFTSLTLFPLIPRRMKAAKRVAAMVKIKQAADYLVIKDNRKRRLFIRYFGG